jgi:hypothetical protein
MSTVMSEGCGGSCQQGRLPCDCNRQTAREVNAEYDTLMARNDYDDALTMLGHRVVEWACAVGIIVLVYLIGRGY